MKKLLIFLAATVAAIMAASALDPVAPDMEQIRRNVTDPKSPYYYPELMARYERNETIMTLEDYRHLYFGSIFEEDFNPYRSGDYSALVEALYFKSRHSKAECDQIIKYAELSLKDNPFDLQQIDYLIYALREKRKNNLANIWQYRLNHILEAIVSSGTGVDKENAWYVTSPQHEYFLLNKLGRMATEYSFEEPWFDHIKVMPKGSKDPTDYYFNSHHFLKEYRMKYPDDEDAVDEDYGDEDYSDGGDGAEEQEDDLSGDEGGQNGANPAGNN